MTLTDLVLEIITQNKLSFSVYEDKLQYHAINPDTEAIHKLLAQGKHPPEPSNAMLDFKNMKPNDGDLLVEICGYNVAFKRHGDTFILHPGLANQIPCFDIENPDDFMIAAQCIAEKFVDELVKQGRLSKPSKKTCVKKTRNGALVEFK